MNARIDAEVRLCYIFILTEGLLMRNHYEDDRGVYVAVLKSKTFPVPVDVYLLEVR
jgi:hypothetical protein